MSNPRSLDPRSLDPRSLDPRSRIPHSLRDGFTILEIMIATAILVIGLMGLLALFPVAMRLGTITIEETNAVLIARSVEQAIRDGVQNRKGQEEEGFDTYFLFQHDGVKDPLPRRIMDANPSADYYILFPSPDNGARRERDRGEAYRSGKVFVYPETDGHSWTPTLAGTELAELEDREAGADPNGGGRGGGDAGLADNDGDDRYDEAAEASTYAVYRTYPLSNQFLSKIGIDEDEEAADNDPITQYSYAFTVRPAFRDASLSRSYPNEPTLVPAGELYEFEILVYRSFFYVKGSENEREPILRKTILVHR